MKNNTFSDTKTGRIPDRLQGRSVEPGDGDARDSVGGPRRQGGQGQEQDGGEQPYRPHGSPSGISGGHTAIPPRRVRRGAVDRKSVV